MVGVKRNLPFPVRQLPPTLRDFRGRAPRRLIRKGDHSINGRELEDRRQLSRASRHELPGSFVPTGVIHSAEIGAGGTDYEKIPLDTVPTNCANRVCRRRLHVSNFKHLAAREIGWESSRPSHPTL